MTRTVPLLLILVLGSAGFARAQNVSAYFGLGTATAKSSGRSVDTFGDGVFYNTPRLDGLFGTFGADFMLRPHFGVGGEYSWRFSQGDYAGLKYRPTFWDLNAIWHPTSSTRVVPEIQGGLGGANVKFYFNQRFCDAFAGCRTSNSFLESSNHFQLHFSGGVRFYFKKNLYVRPQVDVRWVNNFTQFGSSWVPQYGVVLGYTFGER